jgi:chromosomal replication initiation ATPase DnaA
LHEPIFWECALLKIASEYLDFNLETARKAKKISPGDKDKRDLMVYLLWRAGRLSNSAIGAYFGLTYSAVSRCVKTISDKILKDQSVRGKYQELKSQIKV